MARLRGTLYQWNTVKKSGLIQGDDGRFYVASPKGFACGWSALFDVRVDQRLEFDATTTLNSHGNLFAKDIITIDNSVANDEPEYGETSFIEAWEPARGFGFVQRPSGESLFFHVTDIRPDFRDRVAEIKVGNYIYHGVRIDPAGRNRAANIELFSAQEQEDLQAGMYANGAVPHDQDERVPRSNPEIPVFVPAPKATEKPTILPTILGPKTRSLSLIELIKRGVRV
jgi:cold shock CspA family protein